MTSLYQWVLLPSLLACLLTYSPSFLLSFFQHPFHVFHVCILIFDQQRLHPFDYTLMLFPFLSPPPSLAFVSHSPPPPKEGMQIAHFTTFGGCLIYQPIKLDFCCTQIFSHKFTHVLVSSQWVFKYVPKVFNVFPNMFFLRAPHFVPYPLP